MNRTNIGRSRPEPAVVRGDAVTFWLCGYTLAVLFMGTNMPSPLYRAYQQTFGFTPLVVTLIFAVYMGVLIPSMLLLGALSDVIGRRRVLLPSIGAAMAGAGLFAAADGTSWLYAARIVQGFSMALGQGAVIAAMAEAEPRGNRARAAVVATGCIVVGAGAGPLVSGLLAEYGPSPLTVVYLLEIVLLSPALYGVSRLGDGRPADRWRPRRPHVPGPMRETFFTASATSFLAWAVTALFLTLVPSYASALAGTTNLALAGGVVALLFAASAVVQLRGQGSEPRWAQRRGLGLLVVGLGILVMAGEVRSLFFLLAATAVAGAGQGLAFLGAMAAVNRAAPPERHADVVSSFSVLTYVGTGAPVIGVGLLANRIPVLAAVELFAGGLAVACLAALVRLAVSDGRRSRRGSGRRATVVAWPDTA